MAGIDEREQSGEGRGLTATEVVRRTPTPAEVNAIIESAVHDTINNFQQVHPMTCRVLRDRLGHPLHIEVVELVRGTVYAQLKAETAEVIDIAALTKAVAAFALNVIGRFLPLI